MGNCLSSASRSARPRSGDICRGGPRSPPRHGGAFAWPSAKHFTSWLSLAPGNKISGGKILSSRTRPSGNRAAALLRLAATTVGRTASYYEERYRQRVLTNLQRRAKAL